MEEKKNQSIAASTEQVREDPDSAKDPSENGPENASEFPAPEEKEAPQNADKGRKKRLALIFILSMLLLLAITLPLLFLDFGEVKDRLFPVKKQEIHYCAPDYQSHIWTDESYLKILGQKGYLELEGGLKFYFRDQESAQEALSQLAQETHGGAVLSAYLNNLLTGAEGEAIQKFYALFSPPMKELCRTASLCRSSTASAWNTRAPTTGNLKNGSSPFPFWKTTEPLSATLPQEMREKRALCWKNGETTTLSGNSRNRSCGNKLIFILVTVRN